jgi:hypothetical protein
MRTVSASRFITVLSAGILLGLPFAGAAWAVGGLVEPLSRATVDSLLRLTSPLQIELAPETEDAVAAATVSSEPVVPAATKAPSPRGPQVVRPQAPQALFIASSTVLKLAQGSGRPRGAFVAKSSLHPAGLRLSGVAALGVGLQDGDILIEALGVSPRSPGQIIGAIIEARAKQARYLSGTLWRRGQTFRIVVEQPYVEPVPQASLVAGPTPS